MFINRKKKTDLKTKKKYLIKTNISKRLLAVTSNDIGINYKF